MAQRLGAYRHKGAIGFSTDLWTLRRVAEVIEALTGVQYHQGHVWRILRDSMGWSLQRPAKQAKERNEEAVKVWISQTWPELKKSQRNDGLARFSG